MEGMIYTPFGDAIHQPKGGKSHATGNSDMKSSSYPKGK